jgi:pyruvate,water dikinase
MPDYVAGVVGAVPERRGPATDTGGVLSHPAIIAREYQVPAVVATGNAAALLHDGQLVTVDGSTGKIDIGS